MSKERKLLLWSIICVVLYILFEYFILSKIDLSKLLNVETSNSTTESNIIVDISIYTFYLLGIVYLGIIVFNKNIDINKHSKGILIWSIIFFILNIISGILGFIAYSNLDKKKSKKRELPTIEYKEFTNKYICLAVFIVCMLIMFVFANYINSLFSMILMYVIMFVMLIIVFRKQLVHDFKIFREYFKEYFTLTFLTWLKSLGVMLTIGLILVLITENAQPNNQMELQSMFNVYPIVIVLLSTIYAPIAEELLFRGVFRKFIKSKYLFILLSGVAFGLIHVIDDSKTLAEFSFVLIYSSLGIFLASLYYKTNNLCTNILFHFLQNTLGVIAMIITYFYK